MTESVGKDMKIVTFKKTEHAKQRHGKVRKQKKWRSIMSEMKNTLNSTNSQSETLRRKEEKRKNI